MFDNDYLESLGPIVHTRHLPTPGLRSEFFARARGGEFIALYRGIHVWADHWNSLDRDEQYRVRVRAAAASEPHIVVSHQSAGALWKLPSVGPWPRKVHTLASFASGGRSTARLVRHAVGLPRESATIEGIDVTSLARTVVDVARTVSFPHAVAVADAALRRTSHPVPGVPRTTLERSDLERELAGVPVRLGSARAARVVDFADPLADRPGESLSRVSMHIAGIEPPELQVQLRGRSGRRYVVDFWWRRFGHIGEFDGDAKYTNAEFLRGRSPERALRDEKAREDDLRAAGHGMSRWGWSIAISPPLLAALLASAGIR